MDPAELVEQEAMALQKPMNEALARGNSEIQQFYSGSTIFVTGATGFLGKLLVEKLLRACNVRRIYVLIREKKGVSANDRLDNMFTNPVFDKLKEMMPDFAAKIYPVKGDTMCIKLGIADEDWKTLTEEVDMIFHGAATVKFDETLRRATLINVRGTREMVYLAQACKKLKLFTHISTAYAAATRETINNVVYEQFYPTPVSPEAMIQLAETLDEEKLINITAHLIDGWPNTYTFTKAIAEEVLRTIGSNLPVCIVRPPIVINTYCEPTPGWSDMSCVYGASGILLGGGLGVIHVLHVKSYKLLCLMPADYVNNAVLVAAWDTIANESENNEEPRIYTISNTKCGFKFSTMSEVIKNDLRKYPSNMAPWYGFTCDVENDLLFTILVWLLHFIPAYLIDGLCYLLRIQKPKGTPSLLKVYAKVHKLSKIMSYFLCNEWFFSDVNLEKAHGRMSEDDRAIYNTDVNTIDWKQMIIIWGIGIRKYIIKDGLKNTKSAIKKQYWLKIANFVVLSIYSYVLYKILFYLVYFLFILAF